LNVLALVKLIVCYANAGRYILLLLKEII